LLPNARSTSSRGPTKVRPARAHAAAISGFRGEKAVARMDRVDARAARHADDVVHVEIGVDRGAAGADPIALVGGEAMPGGSILLGEDRDRPHLQLTGGAHDADGDLAAIGDEKARDLLAHNCVLIYASATSILSPSAPITIAKIRLSERSDVRCASRAPKGASTMLPTVNPISAGT
jgi:hypothetical protein